MLASSDHSKNAPEENKQWIKRPQLLQASEICTLMQQDVLFEPRERTKESGPRLFKQNWNRLKEFGLGLCLRKRLCYKLFRWSYIELQVFLSLQQVHLRVGSIRVLQRSEWSARGAKLYSPWPQRRVDNFEWLDTAIIRKQSSESDLWPSSEDNLEWLQVSVMEEVQQ